MTFSYSVYDLYTQGQKNYFAKSVTIEQVFNTSWSIWYIFINSWVRELNKSQIKQKVKITRFFISDEHPTKNLYYSLLLHMNILWLQVYIKLTFGIFYIFIH